jgi:hypothetical protein
LGFTITKVSWHSQRKGNEGRREEIINRFWVLVNFLQSNQLTKKTLSNSIADISDEFSLESDDLTQLGVDVMKKAYDKWLTKVDEGMSPTDVSILQKALDKLLKKS